VKIAIVSDIHCNIEGLQRGLDLMEPFDELFCAGDVVFQFRWSNEVVQLLRDRNARLVLGNHEETLLGRDGERALSSPKVRHDLVEWLRHQPYRLETVVDGKKVLMTHGSPWEPWKDYHYPHETVWARAASLACDTLIVGHTHFKMAQTFGSTLVINPGSAGDPRDHRNGFQLSCATWDTTSNEVIFYDYPDPTRNFVSHSGLL
jgi:putative phosphoesterase